MRVADLRAERSDSGRVPQPRRRAESSRRAGRAGGAGVQFQVTALRARLARGRAERGSGFWWRSEAASVRSVVMHSRCRVEWTL